VGSFDVVHKSVAIFCLNSDFLLNILHYVLSITLPVYKGLDYGISHIYIVTDLARMLSSRSAIPDL
jgi:hypothetical protein